VTNDHLPQVHIREAIAADAPALAELVTLWGYPADRVAIANRLRRVRADSDSVLVAAIESEVVGWVHVGVYPTLATDSAAELLGLGVRRNWQGHGIGRQLMRAAEAWARQHGCGTMYVRSRISRRQAHAFYRHLGYHQIKTSLTFERSLDDRQGS
jgi:GNAT superfamily N-acetyltransferase